MAQNLKSFVKEAEFGQQFDKFPEGDTYFDLDKTEVEEVESLFLDKFGKTKIQYLLKSGDKEFVAGKQILQRIKEEEAKGFNRVRITRTGLTKENTKYTVVGIAINIAGASK